ncbi:hypothetical protein GcM1_201015 [Golovinomyces cichoracearum]|uniref:Uncharacterized protein n=1 Tax=Golovinomyces cichoracearum TaxID=62708 RepID=A0A420IYE0_9PEZI|nr:hypothetical protein GcM1_201015 [Golovinomyces cichoracearum]
MINTLNMGIATSRDRISLSIGLKSKSAILDSSEFAPQISALINNLTDLRSRIEKDAFSLHCLQTPDRSEKKAQIYKPKPTGNHKKKPNSPVLTVEKGYDELMDGNNKDLNCETMASSVVEYTHSAPNSHITETSSSEVGGEINDIKTSESILNRTTSPDIKSLSSTPFSRPKSDENSSPVAIKELLISAEGLLSRLQTAYAQRTSALHEMIISRDILAEEIEESNSRDQSLRSQLAALANTVTSKDLRIAELEHELMELKLQNSASNTKSPGSISSDVKRFSALQQFKSYSGLSFSFSDEDVCNSDSSIDLDAGGESDCESNTDDSIFSRPRSPAPTSASSIISRSSHLRTTPVHAPTSFSLGTKPYNNKFDSKYVPQPPKTFLGFFMGRGSKIINQPVQTRCKNCSGKESIVAWDTVKILQIENQSLKERIVELEEAVDGALMLL